MAKKMDYFLVHGKELEKKYAGKYIAVIGNKIVAVGNSRLDTYQMATKDLPKNKKLGVYYLPLKEEVLTAL